MYFRIRSWQTTRLAFLIYIKEHWHCCFCIFKYILKHICSFRLGKPTYILNKTLILFAHRIYCGTLLPFIQFWLKAFTVHLQQFVLSIKNDTYSYTSSVRWQSYTSYVFFTIIYTLENYLMDTSEVITSIVLYLIRYLIS